MRRVRIGVPKEVADGETRVGVVPETVARMIKDGFEVVVESGAGRDYNPDADYEEAGASIVEDASGVYDEADVIVKVSRPEEGEVEKFREGQTLICFLNGPQYPELVEKLAGAGVTVFSNESIPRTSVAQSMDALSSMGSIAGYKCALIAADTLGKYVPMLSTAAGTTKAAKVLVFGVAVAGLQAIAIMNRLGAEVFAYDVRPETKEQAQSLGASFVDSDDEEDDAEAEDEYVEYEPKGFNKFMTSLGFYSYAKPPEDEYIIEGEEEPEDEEEDEGWSKEKLGRDQELLRERIQEMDIVITTALIPGRTAPVLVDTEMVESVEHEGVRIVGPVNLPSAMPIHASQLLSRNMYNLLGHLTEDQSEDKDSKDPQLNLDFEDEIIDKTCIAYGGEVRHEPTREALEKQKSSQESEAN
jgi:NAD(P) transhydrogenase subunit alpha